MDFVTASTGLISPYWMGLPIRYIQKNVENRFYLVYPIDNRCERDQTKDRIQRDSSQGGS